jgi:hypothetical protein
MIHRVIKRTATVAALCFGGLATLASATSLQRLSFEELTDNSDVIVHGKVSRSWTAWDSGHHYIWTHYTVQVAGTQKGVQAASVELSEPGGVVNGMGMTISGSVAYKVGDDVLVFLQKMPNGMLRTSGWGQGKYTVDSAGRLHAEVPVKDVDYVDSNSGSRVSPLNSLDGLTVQQAGLRVAARLRATAGTKSGKVQ